VSMHDEELERCLAEFKPRRVRALEVPGDKRVWPLRLVAAAVIFIVGGLSFWYQWQETKGVKDALSSRHVLPTTAVRVSNLNAIALTRLALEDNEGFEALLADRSRSALPSFQGDDSTLRVLAKE
jgi:hypothetical protein